MTCDKKDCKICNITNEMLLKEISILWNNSNRRGQFINIVKEYFGEMRATRIFNAIKRIH